MEKTNTNDLKATQGVGVTETQKIVIDIISQLPNEKVVEEISAVLRKHKLVCDMSYYSGTNRTEFMSQYDEEYN